MSRPLELLLLHARALEACIMLTSQPFTARRASSEPNEGSALTARDFVTLHQACEKSLERFYRESQQTLAQLLLVAQSPADAGRPAALQAQRDEEDSARLDCQQRRRELFGLVVQD